MKKYLFVAMVILMYPTMAGASKLVTLSALDKDYIMLYFKDGEVFYKDDGKGLHAYFGHDGYAEDSLIAFGNELNVEEIKNIENWTITSPDDMFYGNKGKSPENVFRKSKVNNTTKHWEYKLDHWIFLKLPSSLKQGAAYTIVMDPVLNSGSESANLTFDVFQQVSEALHVNLIGYAEKSVIKSADLYHWMGDGGPRDYKSFEGKQAWIYNIDTKEKTEVGKVEFWKESATELYNRNMTGSSVWTIDFTTFKQRGNYRLVVDGIGCSQDFEITDKAYSDPFQTVVKGYYYMRLGEKITDIKPVPRQPAFIPGEDPENFVVYLTDLHPYHEVWKKRRGDTWDEPHFKPAEESIFWQHRLPGNPTNEKIKGGHSDAFDWDRHLGHVSNIYDMLLAYMLSNGKLADDNIGITESGNGIPDIIDEARNEVDFWLSCRDGEAYCHGVTNPSNDEKVMFQAGATTMAAWANAVNCAMLAESFCMAGDEKLKTFYLNESLKAFAFADKQENKQLTDLQEVGDAHMRGLDFKMTAAAYLYNLTGETKWENIMAGLSVVDSDTTNVDVERKWNQLWGTAAYLTTTQNINYPELHEKMKAAVIYQAYKNNIQHMYSRPSRRSSNRNYWQTPHIMHLVVLAHKINPDENMKAEYEKAMILEAGWGLGRNPGNIVEMTGLGSRCFENIYTTGRNDGTPGLHPGHTPFNNLDPWGKSHNGSNPHWFMERGYPAWDQGWPHQEGHFNCRYNWANGEFTPRQTMRGKLLLYGYLFYLGRK